MAQDSHFDVFLSYSSKDKAVVRALAEQLREDGLRVWFDEWKIRPGDDRSAKIEEGLEHSRVLVLCMSANAFGSDWAQLESQTFRFRDPLNKNRRFIPLHLDDSPIKDSLAQFLYIDWRHEVRKEEYAKLLEACQSGAQEQPLTEAQERVQSTLLSLGHSDSIWSVAWSPDGLYALSGAFDHTVRLWDVSKGHCLRVFEGHEGSVRSVAWSPDGQHVLSGSYDDTIRLWEVSNGRCLRVFEGHSEGVNCVGWSPNSLQIISGAEDHTLRLWEVATGRCLRVFKDHWASVMDVAWSPDGQFALSGAYDYTLKLWEVPTGNCLRTFKDAGPRVSSVAWSPSGQYVLSGSYETVRLWEVASGRCLRMFEGHKDYNDVRSVAWSPDGQQALSCSDDETLRLWDIASGRCLRVFKGHRLVC